MIYVLNWPTTRRRVFLQMFRWRIQFRHLAPVHKGVFVSALPLLFLAGGAWRHFGTQVCLPILADMTPILLAIVGIVMSYVQPRKENHWMTTIILIVAGLVGTAILSMNRIAGERAHVAEVQTLYGKIEVVQTQNTSILTTITTGGASALKTTEAERRQNIEKLLRNEYILSRNPIDPEILAGLKMPPEAWMNARLKQLKETWTVSEESPPRGVQPTPRSYIMFPGNPIFIGTNPTHTEGSDFQAGDRIGFNMHYRNGGPNSVQIIDNGSATYIGLDSKPETQEAIIAQFKDELRREDKIFKVRKLNPPPLQTMMPAEERFFTAYGWTEAMGPLIVNQEDLGKLKTGAQVAFVIFEINYRDQGVTHHLRRCMWLQPPASPPGIFHFCQLFNDSD